MLNCQFSQSELFVNDKVIPFNKNIKDMRMVNDIIVVLLDIPIGDHTLDNVYGVNSNGEIIWRIQEPGKELVGNLRHPYVGICISGYKCGVVDFYGRRFFIDENNGSIIGKDFVK